MCGIKRQQLWIETILDDTYLTAKYPYSLRLHSLMALRKSSRPSAKNSSHKYPVDQRASKPSITGSLSHNPNYNMAEHKGGERRVEREGEKKGQGDFEK